MEREETSGQTQTVQYLNNRSHGQNLRSTPCQSTNTESKSPDFLSKTFDWEPNPVYVSVNPATACSLHPDTGV
jgi:hypothetical protein